MVMRDFSMKKISVFILCSIFLLAISFTAAFAQDYFFQVPEQAIDVFLESDGTITIEYYYLFVNGSGAHMIDFIDIGMPGNSQYNLIDITATVDNQPITDIQDSPYVDGVALGLAGNAIPAGGSGIVYVRAENVGGQFYSTSIDGEEYTSMQFEPNWYDSSFVDGSSDMTITFHLPPGVSDGEAYWDNPKSWPGDDAPASGFDEDGRLVYQWSYPNASASEKYRFFVAMPASYIPIETIRTEQTITYNPSDVLGRVIPIACCGGFLGIFALVIYFAAKSAKKRKLKYLPPKIAIEGHGIKRGLTSVEAALLLEQPMDKILTMILFASLKKGAAELVSRDPLKLKVEAKLPEDLREYEVTFLNAFKEKTAASRRKMLQAMMVKLVKSVSTKMKGLCARRNIQKR